MAIGILAEFSPQKICAKKLYIHSPCAAERSEVAKATPQAHFHICVGTQNFFPPDAENFPSARSANFIPTQTGGNHDFRQNNCE